MADGAVALDEAITSFTKDMPHTHAPYNSRAWGHALHSLSSYQGKLKPSLAHWLVKTFSNRGDRVLDLLGGVGTVAFEAALQGRSAFSSDLSPFASTVATAKIKPPSYADFSKEVDLFLASLDDQILHPTDYAAAEFGLNARVRDYYHPATMDEVLKARKILRGPQDSAAKSFIKACILHILHGNRPYALSRTSHPITPFSPTGPFEYRPIKERLISRSKRLLDADLPIDFIPGHSWHSDFRLLPELLPGPVDSIICSPPFPGMRFDRSNWLRMWFCGWMEEDFDQTSKAFLERQQGRDFAVYEEFFAVCAEVSSAGSPVVLHVGGSKSYDMASQLVKIGSRHLKHKATISENVDHLSNHGIKDKGATSSHILLVFKRT